MSGEVRWLIESVVRAVHGELLAEHSGPPGLRDAGLLASALANPQHCHVYGSPDIADLAAHYAHAIVRNHPFVDGNKRVAFAAAQLFLRLNGRRIDAPHTECVLTMRDLAAGELDASGYAGWLRSHLTPASDGI